MSQEKNKTEVKEKAVQKNFKTKVADFFKNIKWQKPLSPVVGYSILGGVLVVAIVLVLVCCL